MDDNEYIKEFEASMEKIPDEIALNKWVKYHLISNDAQMGGCMLIFALVTLVLYLINFKWLF